MSTTPSPGDVAASSGPSAAAPAAMPRAVVLKALLLLAGNQFSFYEDRQWVPLDSACTRIIVAAVAANALEALYSFRGRNRRLDLARLIQREAGSPVGQVMRVLRADGLEMMRGNPQGDVMINPAAEAALPRPGAPAPASGGPPAAGGGPTAPVAAMFTPAQRTALGAPDNNWLYAHNGRWYPIPQEFVRGLANRSVYDTVGCLSFGPI